MKQLILISTLLFSSLFLSTACSPQQTTALPIEILPTQITTRTMLSPTIRTTAQPSSTPTLIELTATPFFSLCPPLPGYSFSVLETAISNPYNPPEIGSDNPHQGVDLAVMRGGIALSGAPVQVVMSGVVAAVINNSFPYGNAIMLETPLEILPYTWLDDIQVPQPIATLEQHPSLTCPIISPAPDWETDKRSLYILYAHLQEPVDYTLGDQIQCGDPVGEIGQSGNALNPHLHLEVRVGPAESRFEGLAHYDARVSPEEMYYYCTWRVSGLFQLVHPVQLLSLQ